MGKQFPFPGTQHILDLIWFDKFPRLGYMLCSFLCQLDCPPNYSFQFWLEPIAQPIPTKGDHSLLSGRSFASFLFTLLKQTNCAILVDILCRLVDTLRIKLLPSNIILINFISISGTDCTCLSIDTSPSKHSSFSNNLILIAVAVLVKLG